MNPDKGISLFWLLFGLFLIEESYRLELGELRKPDSGLFPFFVGIIIAGLSLILLFQTLGKESKKEEKKDKISYRNILLSLMSLYAYALIFEWLGFIPSTFFLILFLVKFVGQRGWGLAIIIAFLTSLASYVFFEVWLRSALPKGIFRI